MCTASEDRHRRRRAPARQQPAWKAARWYQADPAERRRAMLLAEARILVGLAATWLFLLVAVLTLGS
jgi:hypothetical protein